jgi:alpha-tubulin suppressor-like RCC1 family protein
MIKNAFGIITLLAIVAILAVGGSECSKKKKVKTGSSVTSRDIYAPGGLVATPISSSQISLAWVDTSPRETGYYVERNSGSGFSVISTIVGADIAVYDDKPVSPSTTYTYRVQAYSSEQGPSAYSTEASATSFGNWNNVYAGYLHTIGIIGITSATNNSYWAFGFNGYGQLGFGDYSDRWTPTQMGTPTDWSIISAGLYHNLAIRTNRTLWAWGANNWGQLGDGTIDNRTTPRPIGSVTDWNAIDCGGTITGTYPDTGNTSFSLVLRANNALSSTGFNLYGQLGQGITTTYVTTWDVVTNTTDWVSFAAGDNHVIARKTNNTLWSWGYNDFSQLGLGDSAGISRTTPSAIGALSDWASVFAGGNHSLAMKTDGSLWSWGSNWVGQLGVGSTVSTTISAPTQVGTDSDWSAISSGTTHVTAIKTNKTIWAWGGNTYGQLGLGNNTQRNAPTQIGTLSDWSIIASGGLHTLAINVTTRSLWAWGSNSNGQLGLGGTLDRNSPTLMVGK